VQSEVSTDCADQDLDHKVGELERELAEAHRREAATAEVLRAISRSRIEVQPVFDTIVKSAVRLCDGLFSGVYQFDGELLHHVAHHNYTPEALEEVQRKFPARPTRDFGTGRAILEGVVVHMPDVEVDPEYRNQPLSRAVGMRSGLFVPMLRDGAPVGVILVARAEPGAFSDSEINLLKSFADQAVIAIENARLFEEVQARTKELSESLEYQTAMSEVLGVISKSPSDVQPVFDTIASSALRLCGAKWSVVTRFDSERMHLAALHNLTDPAGIESIRRIFPRVPNRGGPTDRAIMTGRVVHLADVLKDPEYIYQAVSKAAGYRSHLAVPMLREGRPVGAITVAGTAVGGFSERQVGLLRAFADQAVIAIENARLFEEVQAGRSARA
jgi:two-component system, NtrC family, sensor kinase